MKSREYLKRRIEGYLEEGGMEEEVFGGKYEKGEKKIEDWVRYMVNWVEKRGWKGFWDEEIYGEGME